MSQMKKNQDLNTKNKSINGLYSKQKFTKGMERDFHYKKHYNSFQYYNAKYNFHSRWNYRRKRPYYKHPQAQQRPKSPQLDFPGNEEYALKKIQEFSDLLKRKLLTPESEDLINAPSTSTEEKQPEIEQRDSKSEKSAVKSSKKAVPYNVEEIQYKIMTHITNLSHGKKMNLICANSSGYDVAIAQIHKQKRLELSKVFRDMCSNPNSDNSEAINSIIPDIGIKIEDLPLEVIQKLSTTLDLDLNLSEFLQNRENVCVEAEACENDSVLSNLELELAALCENDIPDVPHIKQEPADINPEFQDENINDQSSEFQIKQECIDIIDSEMKQEDSVIGTDFEDGIGHSEFESDFLIKNETFDIPIISDVSGNTENVILSNKGPDPRNIEAKNEFQTPLLNKYFVCVGSQTELLRTNSVVVQTDVNLDKCKFVERAEKVNNLDDAIDAMISIDEEIMRLTKLRQSIFTKIQKQRKCPSKKAPVAKRKKNVLTDEKKSKPKIGLTQKDKNKVKITNNNGKVQINDTKINDCDTLEKEENYITPVNLEHIPEKILVMKVIEETLLAATDNGTIYYISTKNGSIIDKIAVPKLPIISLCIFKTTKNKLHFLVGALNTKYEYNYESKELLRLTQIKDTIQCMEVAWDHVFIGTAGGNLVRYSLKYCKIEFDENIAFASVMVLKATQEGARRVLLVGMRNAPVTVRDAMSGLHLRTMNELVTPTVYCLLLEKSMVFCGTTSHDVLVFSFHDGNIVHKHQTTNSRGISCLKIVDDLLFASCYNGNIYVYDIKNHQYVGLIEGPGGVILSMEIVKNLVIVGTMSLNFKSILIPDHILRYNK